MPKLILILLLALLPATSGFAQTDTPFFNVELLLFQRTNAAAGSSEYWSRSTDIPFKANAVNIQYQKSVGYTLLPDSSRELSPDRIALERAGGYQPLLHVKWRQPGLSKKRALPIYLKGQNLEGTVTISLSRYLHANFDMLLNRFSPNAGEYISHPFQEHRKMRSNELHYVDHPLLVALIKITRHQTTAPEKPPEQATPEQTDTEEKTIQPN